MNEDEQLKAWLDPQITTVESLYEALAQTAPRSNAFGGDLVKQGRAMLLGLRAQLHSRICGNERIVRHPAIAGTSQVNDSLALAALVAAEIPTEIGSGVNKLLIAALLVRIGIRQFCEGPAVT